METPISISLLDQVEIAKPCNARWEDMAGDERKRHCSECSLSVYNLSAMSREEADDLIASADGRMCVRLYRRQDGTVLTEDCPVGLRALRQRTARAARNIAATAVTVLAGVFGFGSPKASSQPREIMGKMMMPAHAEPAHAEPADTVRAVDTVMVRPDTTDARAIPDTVAAPDTASHPIDETTRFIMGEMAIAREPEPTQPIDRVQPVDPIEAVEPVQALEPVLIVAPVQTVEPTCPPDGHPADTTEPIIE